jgi:peroxiredoxin
MLSQLQIFLSGCLLLAGSLLAQAAPGPLPDQNNKTISLADYRNQPVVVIVVSGRKLRHVKKWEEGLRAVYPELTTVRIADINDEPRPTQEQVADKLRKRAPADVSIMIDLNNIWANEYQLDTSEPCLLLFDDTGQLVAEFRGRANQTRLAEVTAALTPLLTGSAADNLP